MSSKKPRALRSVSALHEAGLIHAEAIPILNTVVTDLPVGISAAMHARMDAQNPFDPLAQQWVPSVQESLLHRTDQTDPIGDQRHSPVPGIVHRHADRCLLKPLSVCAVYCRFCFRRDALGEAGLHLSAQQLEAALDYIRAHPTIWEVILTGGDPLMLTPKTLQAIFDALDAIPHVQVIRLHTRVPVVDPPRVTQAMQHALASVKKSLFVVLHSNHSQEWSDDAVLTCRQLQQAGIPLLGQTVLLKGVNDSFEALASLMKTFVKHRIKPYYLHHADLVPHTHHFRTTIAHGQALMRELREKLSGLCQPTYVLDIPGGFGKVPIDHCFLQSLSLNEQGEECAHILDTQGIWHDYP